MAILIKNGRIITSKNEFNADIFIENQKISLIGNNLNNTADRIIDAKGKFVIPGGIDVHTHLDMPYGQLTSADDFETGTIAAAFGGTTSIIDFATQSKGESLHKALDKWNRKAERKAVVDYGFHMIITDIGSNQLNEMDELVKEGVTSFKLFMAYPGRLMMNDENILKVMLQAKRNGSLICVHAENGMAIEAITNKMLFEKKLSPKYHALSRPEIAEAEAINRAIQLSKKAGTPLYIVHLTCNEALLKVESARKEGLPVFAETCPQYLFLSLDDINKPDFEGAKYVFSPPVREKWNREKLWEGIKQKSLQVVSTDHCPFNFKDKKKFAEQDFTKIPNGGASIENRLHLTFQGVNDGKISLTRWVEINSTNPAKLFGMYPQKGEIKLGCDADIVIWNPETEHTISAKTHHMNVDYSMYEGMKIKGDAEIVLSRGEVIVENSKFRGTAGRGNFIMRDAYGSE